EGVLVAEIERVEATARVGGLFSKKLDLSNARIVRPRLYLVQDDRGLNLMRAVAAKRAGAGASAEGSSRVQLSLDALALEEGYVDFVRGDQRATLEDLGATGSASFDSDGPDFAAR